MSKDYNDNDVERILRMYPKYKAAATIEQEELQCLFPSCTPVYDDMPKGSKCSDQTGNLALKRCEAGNNMKKARAIEIAVSALDVRCREFVRLYYFEIYQVWEVMEKLAIEKSQFYRMRRHSLDVIADLLCSKVA